MAGLPCWSLVKEGAAKGSMALDLEAPLNEANPRSPPLEIEDAAGRTGVANEGLFGINCVEGEKGHSRQGPVARRRQHA